ncbi:MAG TPA: DUF6015 family protein [Candidatus Thermoplasmatota archaeon]|nr:DUF6015 family protein [Candidatus Thermoplasmatota archaeon]
MHIEILTLSQLARAMQSTLHLGPEDAEERAEQLLDLFGVDSHLTDNRLDPGSRTFFYQLERGGLMTTRSETTILLSGQEWRTHYWILKLDRIQKAAGPASGAAGMGAAREDEDTAAVYRGLPEACWSHH